MIRGEESLLRGPDTTIRERKGGEERHPFLGQEKMIILMLIVQQW